MSWQALDWAGKQTVGHAHSKAILMHLANWADEKGSCFPSHERLAAITEISVRTVQDCMKRLETEGYVESRRDRREDGRLGLTRYRLRLDRPALRQEASPPEEASGGDHRQIETQPPEGDAETTGSCFRSDTLDYTPQEHERESAGARDEEAKALHRRFRALAARYPGSHLDPLTKSEPIWQLMPEDKRKRAEGMLPAFVAALKGSRRRPPLHEYLGEDKFDLIGSEQPKDVGGMVALAPFSRDFWLVFHKRAAQGQRRVGLMVDQAKRAIPFGVDRTEAPTEAEIASCWRVDIGSAEWKAWTDYWTAKGVLMPRPNAASFAWMPSRWPPDQATGMLQPTTEEIDEVMGS